MSYDPTDCPTCAGFHPDRECEPNWFDVPDDQDPMVPRPVVSEAS